MEHDRFVVWDAFSDHIGGAEVAAWDASLDMESLDFNWSENADAAASLVVYLAKAFKKVRLFAVWQWSVRLKFLQSVKNSLW